MTTTNDDTDGPSPIAVLDGRVSRETAGTALDLDAFYGLLAEERRRRLLCHLRREADDGARFADLVGLLAAEDDGLRRREAATVLFHVDLPALSEAGVLEFDPAEAVVLARHDTVEWLLAWVDRVEGTLDEDRHCTLDEWFDLLADPWRRRALSLLWDHHTVSLADVADEVAVADHGTPITDVPAASVLDVYLSLYHDHVPPLAEAGVVEYDQETDTLALERGALPVTAPLPGDGGRTERQ
ncbi:DUF7344 domain-containing protein [Halomarina litorea]|uniref:DUF7344 domain-containing protein n=1 Tax=Halomarina litorea TaxID=2961595 RepID=UPI0020C26989|nr:hypothetical protein [Halomarina sp. BCD28]